MKRLSMIVMCLLTMMMVSPNVKAQEITITLNPGWNWIGYTKAEVMDIATALGSFTPVQGDMIKSQQANASYSNGQWRGSLQQFTPGLGYHYYSNRTETVSFVFDTGIPQVTVTTAIPTNITTTSAVCSSTVVASIQSHIFARGLCWSTNPNPTINGNHTSDGTNNGSLSNTLEGLNPNTTYYVRAYVVSDNGLIYGNEESFTTLEGGGSGNAQNGTINGLFTINANGDQVYFSQGNLQYQASTNTWRFAENQWDYIGYANSNISPTYDGWIDLLGWGTSGFNHGAACYQPWSTSENYYDYYAYGLSNSNLNDQTGQADWGYNAISNGGNQENLWRTLTMQEWHYLIKTRNTPSGIRWAVAKVNNKNGIIILPDNWSSSIYTFSIVNGGWSYSNNVISATEWVDLFQANGAVFLPAAGSRYKTSVGDIAGGYGNYYSTTYYSDGMVYILHFDAGETKTQTFSPRYNGFSVRLVRDAE